MKRTVLLICVSVISLFVMSTAAQEKTKPAAVKAMQEIDAFNQKMTEVTLHMDNAGTMSLWAEDGITLLPGMAPVKGKKNIAKFLDDAVAGIPGWKVTKQEDTCHDIEIAGDWATEWCDTHQVIQPPGDKPVMEIFGKMMLVLHREKDGKWLMKREMWNQGVKPEEKINPSRKGC